jgi:RNA recognition motif-containing protein
MAAYDAQNPTLLSSGVEEKPTVPAKLKKENEDLSSRSISQPKMEIDRTSLNPAAGSRRLYVGNFAYTTTERDLTSLFRRYSIESITMPQDRVTNRPAGYAFIEISTAQEAECAIDEFSNKRFGDRRLTVQFAMPDPAQASSTSSNKLRSALVSNNYVQSRQVISSGRPIDQPVSSMVVNSTPASSDTHRPDPAWDEFYANQEGVMELRAIKGNFRHDFFLFLQKARDLARQTHPLCSRPIRGYLADKLTWKHFCEYSTCLSSH